MTSDHHVDTELLIDLIENRLGPEAQEEVCQHVEICPECDSEIESLREIIGELHKPEIWGERLPEWTMAPSTPFSSGLAALAHRLDEEEQTGLRIAAVLLELPQQEWREALGQMCSAPRAGIARAFVRTAYEHLHTTPAISLALAEEAAKIASTIDDAEYDPTTIALLRASCLKEQANALRFLGRHREALSALDRAETYVADIPGSGLHLAALDHIRGTILRETGDLDAALLLARRAADQAVVFGDINRLVQFRMLEANTLAAAGDNRRARETSLELLRLSERAGDEPTTALLLGNIGSLSLRLNEESQAVIYLRKAAELYGRLEMPVPALRLRWTLALMLLHQSRLNEAEAKLVEVAESFSRLQMRVEEALVRLELAEIFLTAHRSREAQSACRHALSILQHEAVGPAVLTALAYLQESAAMASIDTIAIRETHTLLQQIPHERPFVTLDPPNR